MGFSLRYLIYLIIGINVILPLRAAELSPEQVNFFEKRIQPVLKERCYTCHSAQAADLKSGFMLDSKAGILKGGDSGKPAIVPNNPDGSLLIQAISHKGELKMPLKGEKLSDVQIVDFVEWVKMGAPDPRTNEVLTANASKAAKHWSFKPIAQPAVPNVKGQKWVRTPIDAFVLAKLEEQGISPSRPAEKRTLLRRVSYDLTGLPPTPVEIQNFLEDNSPEAFEKVVDRLLASPRYGERWARHWLDVVRFAETTGFEVNTPRENAWPFRDYVIRSLNDDKPYDRFVMEQLAGDALGAEDATGFLVGGPNDQVKSPDIVLTRQQRSDELHDMVSTTGSAFLGLTVGCARCHSHKFDPISQVDYYAITAVFSGVHHGERQLRSADFEQRMDKAAQMRKRVADLEGEVSDFEPIANPDYQKGAKPSHKLNEETFAPVLAKFVRFTIHQTERHPTIGEIEPCLDELEIYSAGDKPQNVALAAHGAKATASGTIVGGDQHKLEHLNDGRYGNPRSWISNERGRGWVQIELPQATNINRIVWGRDRSGEHLDRLPVIYTIEVGSEESGEMQWKRVAGTPPFRSAVHPRHNVERFAPVAAKFVRFTISETSGLEPCIDELEIYTADAKPRNVALASTGAKASASSVYPDSTIHRLEHLNDGLHGNGRSWISRESGKGWVQVELPETHSISKIVWGRDREEKFADRLATNYRIEVATDTNSWKTVASSVDRHSYVAGQNSSPMASEEGLDESGRKRLSKLLEERKALENKIVGLTTFPMVYAGTFSVAEPTFRLHRGEAMQPREVVPPGALASFGAKLSLPVESPEQERRVALARWITDPKNPLTARVIVNRLWQYHFGEGIVSTSSDFGLNGAKPSHPELLDWLATELVRGGWKLKAMHRAMLLSNTYQQSSEQNEKAFALDAGNRLLWRYTPRRLEAEPIRDSILTASGKLDLKMGGPGYHVFQQNDNYVRVYEPKVEFGPAEWRRMIYQFKPRMQQDATFGAFDCPDGGQIAPRRGSSTTPLQALNLLNSTFMMQQAKLFAERLQREESVSKAQVQRAFALIFNRSPSQDEISAGEKIVAEQGLPIFCRAILNANEFLYVF